MKDHEPSDTFCSSAQGYHGPSLAGSLPQIRPVNVLVSGTDCQGKEYAGGEHSPRDVAVNAQMHIKRKENKPSLHMKGTLGKVHKRTELPGSSGAHHSSFDKKVTGKAQAVNIRRACKLAKAQLRFWLCIVLRINGTQKPWTKT